MTTVAAEPQYATSGLVRLTKPQLVGTMMGLVLTMLLAALDQTIVGTAEPRIIASLSGFDRYPWVATAYMLASTLVIPIVAKLSDLHGRKLFFLSGAIIFVAASALCGASGDLTFLPMDGMSQLILFRGIQGIGAGMIMGLIFVIVGDIFSPAERGRYQGFFSAVWGLSSIFGPTLGGWLTDSISWRATFYVNLPVGLIAIAAVYTQFPNFKPHSDRQKVIDWAGMAALILCMGPLLLALTWVTQYGWESTRVIALLAWSLVMLPVFLLVEKRAVEPMLPLSLFSDPVIRTCSMLVFLLGMGMFGVIIYFPLFMQGVMGASPTQSGTLMTPMMLGTVSGSFIAGQLTFRLKNYKVPGIIGSVLVTAGMATFATLDADSTRLHILIGMILAGLGMGFQLPVYTVAVQNAAPRAQMGSATASTTFFRAIGSTLGVAIFGSVLLTRYHNEFARGVPPGTPQRALAMFSNPLLLVQMRPQLEAVFSGLAGGLSLMQLLMGNVKNALVHGLHLIFVSSAVMMVGAVMLNILLKNVPLRSQHYAPPSQEPPAH
jgi:EmrB/QacA subfamily drug resistance transporter